MPGVSGRKPDRRPDHDPQPESSLLSPATSIHRNVTSAQSHKIPSLWPFSHFIFDWLWTVQAEVLLSTIFCEHFIHHHPPPLRIPSSPDICRSAKKPHLRFLRFSRNTCLWFPLPYIPPSKRLSWEKKYRQIDILRFRAAVRQSSPSWIPMDISHRLAVPVIKLPMSMVFKWLTRTRSLSMSSFFLYAIVCWVFVFSRTHYPHPIHV